MPQETVLTVPSSSASSSDAAAATAGDSKCSRRVIQRRVVISSSPRSLNASQASSGDAPNGAVPPGSLQSPPSGAVPAGSPQSPPVHEAEATVGAAGTSLPNGQVVRAASLSEAGVGIEGSSLPNDQAVATGSQPAATRDQTGSLSEAGVAANVQSAGTQTVAAVFPITGMLAGGVAARSHGTAADLLLPMNKQLFLQRL